MQQISNCFTDNDIFFYIILYDIKGPGCCQLSNLMGYLFQTHVASVKPVRINKIV